MKQLLLISLILLPLKVSAQLVYPMYNSVDDRANGMGRLSITSAQGADAIFTNPALLPMRTATRASPPQQPAAEGSLRFGFSMWHPQQ